MSGEGATDLAIWQVLSAYIFVVIILIIVRIKKITRENLIDMVTVRMMLQLILVGYVLIFIFENPHPLLTLGIILFMLGFAIFNVYQRTKETISISLKKMIALAMFVGLGLSIAFFML